jgi:hypothetical protein
MLSIFNGRSRTLGKASGAVFAQLSVEFREHLHLFKGARLHVFLCIALHADEQGWAFPGIETRIKRETGYNRDTIIQALNDLCAMTIEGHRVLLAYQPVRPDGTFQANQYLIFPTIDEVAQYETNNARRRKPRVFHDNSPSRGFPNTAKPNSDQPSTENPNTAEPNTENVDSKQSQPQQKPTKAKPAKNQPPSTGGDDGGVLAQRAAARSAFDTAQRPVFDELDALLAHYRVEGETRVRLAEKLARDAEALDGSGIWMPMAARVINCWRACERAHKTGRVGNATGFIGFFVYKLRALDDAYLATGDERAAQREASAHSGAVAFARSIEASDRRAR